MFVNTREIMIEWGDCDPAEIVYYPRYFAMFDTSTAALFSAALGYSKFELLKKFNAVGFPMVDTGAQFFLPSKYGDMVSIETQITEFGRSSFKIAHRLFNDNKLAIEAYEKRVWVVRDPNNPEKLRSEPLPEEVTGPLSKTTEKN